MSSSISSWLRAAQTDPAHLETILHTLATREQKRDAARRASFNGLAHPHNPIAQAQARACPEAYTIKTGTMHPEMNRYSDITPYDSTIVRLDGGRYLNASWVRELFGGPTWWIAAQAPTPTSALAFLSAIREHGVRTVIQLTLNVENRRVKADPYFPAVVGDTVNVGREYEVTLVKQGRIDEARCVRSTVSISTAPGKEGVRGGIVVFDHYLYTAWPDFGVPAPEDRASLLAFIRLVHDGNAASGEDPYTAMIVGCSAGVGRTGSFIALSSLLRKYGFLRPSNPNAPVHQLPESALGPLEIDDKVALEIDSLREQRPGAVQRDAQVRLIYTVLSEAFAEQARGRR